MSLHVRVFDHLTQAVQEDVYQPDDEGSLVIVDQMCPAHPDYTARPRQLCRVTIERDVFTVTRLDTGTQAQWLESSTGETLPPANDLPTSKADTGPSFEAPLSDPVTFTWKRYVGRRAPAQSVLSVTVTAVGDHRRARRAPTPARSRRRTPRLLPGEARRAFKTDDNNLIDILVLDAAIDALSNVPWSGPTIRRPSGSGGGQRVVTKINFQLAPLLWRLFSDPGGYEGLPHPLIEPRQPVHFSARFWDVDEYERTYKHLHGLRLEAKGMCAEHSVTLDWATIDLLLFNAAYYALRHPPDELP